MHECAQYVFACWRASEILQCFTKVILSFCPRIFVPESMSALSRGRGITST
eukprot:COSAG05_NODE_18381_length_309_cov_0.738095_1_plen_50_part_01